MTPTPHLSDLDRSNLCVLLRVAQASLLADVRDIESRRGLHTNAARLVKRFASLAADYVEQFALGSKA